MTRYDTHSSELSWSHYNLLMRIEDEKSRQFYANECVKSNWSVRQLKRQIGTFYYERLLTSQDKESIEKEIELPEKVEPKNIIKDPYVLEFYGRHFFIDLVFYNYILKCFVIIDLKLGDLTHQDLGQMQMYVNYYTREMMNEGDNPPIGIVLCADKSDQVVKYTLPEDNNQIFASKYKVYLPTEEEFNKELNLDNYVKKEDDEIK